MPESQLDRIETMLKQLIRSSTNIEMKGTDQEAADLRDKITTYERKPTETGVNP